MQGLIGAHEQFKGTLGDADKEFNSIVALTIEVKRICSEHGVTNSLENPYTTLNADVCTLCSVTLLMYVHCVVLHY